jgi:two-component system, chemotaxis family, protein-glutamate methylesterase/glutaminase
MNERIKVLIIDDSAIVRDVLSERLALFPDIEVVGTAPDPFIGRDKIVALKPDVITLDIEMPRLDGLSFLERLMVYYPMPVIIVSSVTASDGKAAIRALEIGAFDVVNKPGGSISVGEIIDEIAFKIRQAYEIKDSFAMRRVEFDKAYSQAKRPRAVASGILGEVKTTDKLICLGSSTGGTVALEYLLPRLPAKMPPILVVQHMPPNFTRQFAERLDSLSSLTVKEAENGELIDQGTAFIAPGGFHLRAERKGANLFVKLTTSARVNFQRPAADVLFASAAESAGRNVIAALLTGMGRDGAEGLAKLRAAGAMTIAQDEKSSVVWGMPKAAIDLGAAVEVLSLDAMPQRLIELSRRD